MLVEVVAFVFQALALNIATLDIHGVNDLSVLGALPCFCGILALAVADRRLSGTLEPEQRYLSLAGGILFRTFLGFLSYDFI